MDIERQAFLKRIDQIRENIKSMKRQYNGEPEPTKEEVFTSWEATLNVDGKTVPLSHAKLTIKANNKVGNATQTIEIPSGGSGDSGTTQNSGQPVITIDKDGNHNIQVGDKTFTINPIETPGHAITRDAVLKTFNNNIAENLKDDLKEASSDKSASELLEEARKLNEEAQEMNDKLIAKNKNLYPKAIRVDDDGNMIAIPMKLEGQK